METLTGRLLAKEPQQRPRSPGPAEVGPRRWTRRSSPGLAPKGPSAGVLERSGSERCGKVDQKEAAAGRPPRRRCPVPVLGGRSGWSINTQDCVCLPAPHPHSPTAGCLTLRNQNFPGPNKHLGSVKKRIRCLKFHRTSPSHSLKLFHL